MNKNSIDKVILTAELSKIFKPSKSNDKYIGARESKTVEFKESYNHGSMAKYFKTMASFANADGGYIIFGIGDSPRIFKGLSRKSFRQFDSLKIEEFTNNLNEYFQPEINWTHTFFRYEEKIYGVIYTFPLTEKPCICSKTYDTQEDKYSLKEGDIYYRYNARSQKIRYSELRKIFEENIESEAKKWKKLIEKIAKIGVSNALLLNIGTGEVETGNSTIVLNDELLTKIKFIKEGKFVEKDGAPTLKLIGDVSNIETPGMIIETPTIMAIKQDDVLLSFLNDEELNATESFEYIKVILYLNSGFQPIYYYLNKSIYTMEKLLEYIEKNVPESRVKKIVLERLNGRKESYTEYKNTNTEAAKNKKKFLDSWKNKTIIEEFNKIKKDMEYKWILQSFYMVPDEIIINGEKYYKEVFILLYNNYYKTSSSEKLALYRKAICRLDEVIYFNKLK